MNNDRNLSSESEGENSQGLVTSKVKRKGFLFDHSPQIDVLWLKLQTIEIEIHSVGWVDSKGSGITTVGVSFICSSVTSRIALCSCCSFFRKVSTS